MSDLYGLVCPVSDAKNIAANNINTPSKIDGIVYNVKFFIFSLSFLGLSLSNLHWSGHGHSPGLQEVSTRADQLRNHHSGMRHIPFGNQQKTQGSPPTGTGAGQKR